jgi:hypothetical protein
MYVSVSQNKTHKLDSTQLNKTENQHNIWEAASLSSCSASTSVLRCTKNYARQAPGMSNTKPKQWILKPPNARPVLPSWHTLRRLRSPPRTIRAAISPQRLANQIKTTSFRGVQTSSPRPLPLKPLRKLEELTPPPFTTPINQSPDDSHIYGNEWAVFVLFRYFRVATNFEPAWGGRLRLSSVKTNFIHVQVWNNYMPLEEK